MMYYYKRYGESKIEVMEEALNDAMSMAPSHLTLCIQTKKQLDGASDIANALPACLVSALKKNNKGTYRNSNMYLLTERITPSVQGGIAIAPFSDINKLLPHIKRCAPDAIIYIPWMKCEISAYCSQHTNAKELP